MLLKPLDKLTKEELQDLLFINGVNGLIIKISDIVSIDKTRITLANEQRYTIDPLSIERVTDKILLYETYKLMNASEDINKKVKEVQEEQLKEYFTETLENVQQQASKVLNHVMSVTTSASNLLDDLTESTRNLKNFATTYDVNNIKSKISDHLDDLAPIKKEYKDIITSLKDLLSKD